MPDETHYRDVEEILENLLTELKILNSKILTKEHLEELPKEVQEVAQETESTAEEVPQELEKVVIESPERKRRKFGSRR